jgi:hypothetical protein
MAHIQLVFLVLAFVLFLLAGLNVSYPRVSFGWLGLAFLTLGVWLRP